jgi:hypothetical protein
MSDVWVGLTEVSKSEGCELDFNGAAAFVWWATQADSEEGFVSKLSDALKHYKLVLRELSEMRRFEDANTVSEELRDMVDRARQDANWVLFGTFFIYPHYAA